MRHYFQAPLVNRMKLRDTIGIVTVQDGVVWLPPYEHGIDIVD